MIMVTAMRRLSDFRRRLGAVAVQVETASEERTNALSDVVPPPKGLVCWGNDCCIVER